VVVPISARSRPYVIATVTVVIAGLIRAALDPWLGRAVPYLLYYPAVTIAAWNGGFGPGVLATLLAAGAAVFRYFEPVTSLAVANTGDVLALGIFSANGVLVALFGERALRAAIDQRRFAAIADSTEDAIIAKDLDSVITAWNIGAERLFGYTAAEAIGKPITMIIPHDRWSEEDRVIADIRNGRRIAPFETIRQRKDGSLVDVSVTVSAVRLSSGAIVGASKIARDISFRRKADELREELIAREREAHEEAVAARNRLAFLAEVGAVLTSSLDYEVTLDRAVHLALPRLGDYCNVLVENERGQLRHVAWGHVVREKEPVLRQLAGRLLENGGAQSGITFAEAVMKSGQTKVVTRADIERAVAAQRERINGELQSIGAQLQACAYVGAPLRVRGRVVGVMSFGMTEPESGRQYTPIDVELVEEFARRVSVAIENARLFRHTDELNRLKDEFLATLSHELRTPLAAVLGWSRMLATGTLDQPKQSQAIEAIERNAQAQARIVDDILDVARGMSGNVRVELEHVDLVSVAQRSVEAIAPTAVAKKIRVDVRGGEPVTISADPNRLQQVVWNLLSNAVKFTPAGGQVTVDVSANDGFAVLTVTDTGVGIPPEFLPYVFDKFRQADASFTRQYGGLGLGLAIARHLIELHGGSIEARSAGEGNGATFVVRLPRSPDAAA
jgi:PAS domain S-box-containing protein